MMRGVNEEATTFSSFSEQVKNLLESFSPFTIGMETGNEVDNQKEGEDNREIDDIESQMSLSSSTQENEATANTENDYSAKFGAVRIKNKTIDDQECSCNSQESS